MSNDKHEREMALRKRLGIPPSAEVQILDLGYGEVETKTAGWTDTQIENKTLEEIDGMISQGTNMMASLQETIRKESERISDLHKIRRRKLKVGGK